MEMCLAGYGSWAGDAGERVKGDYLGRPAAVLCTACMHSPDGVPKGMVEEGLGQQIMPTNRRTPLTGAH